MNNNKNINEIKIGGTYYGRITGFQPYGLFVKIGKYTGLIHKSSCDNWDLYKDRGTENIGFGIVVEVKDLKNNKISFKPGDINNLKSIYIDDKIKTIGIKNIPNIKITINKNNSNFVYINGAIITKDKKTLVSLIRSDNSKYTVPDNIEVILPEAIPDNITSINFNQCKVEEILDIRNRNLEEISMENSKIKHIGRLCFAYTKIKQIVLPKSIEKIDYCAFERCTMLKEIKFKKFANVSIDDAFVGDQPDTVSFDDDTVSVYDLKYMGISPKTKIYNEYDKKDYDEKMSNSKYSLEDIRQIMIKNDVEKLRIKWCGSSSSLNDGYIYSLKTYIDNDCDYKEYINVILNDWVYHVYPYQIEEVILNNDDTETPHPEDWFGTYGSDR